MRCAGNIACIGEFEERMGGTLTVCLKLTVLKDRDGTDVEFDPAIVSLAVSWKGSVLDFLICNFKKIRTQNIGFKIDICSEKVSMRIKLAIPRELDAL